MSLRVCVLSEGALGCPEGGFLWVLLNWVLGLKAIGCEVLWLERIPQPLAAHRLETGTATLRSCLAHYGLEDSLVVWSCTAEPLPEDRDGPFLGFEPGDADLLLNIGGYTIPAAIVSRFRRSALLDTDPGLLQIWMTGDLEVAGHDVYFTIGETVGRPGALFPDAGLKWEYTPPCVALDWWTPHPARPDAPFTTVSHWWGDWVEEDGFLYANDKRAGFLPFMDIPRRTSQALELAVDLGREDDDNEWTTLQRHGWRVRNSYEMTSTPWDYQRYIQRSRGEFSCVKPSCIRLQNAWISDRTICYLASGKPAIIQHTGRSRFLPEDAGLHRFRDVTEAVRCLETVAGDYDRQCRLARAVAEEHFDARIVVPRVLERALA